jgi:hypothetical protein
MIPLFHGRDGTPLSKPEDVIKFLGKGDKHWRQGRSAYELAHCWFAAQAIPETVRAVLATDATLGYATLVKGIFETQTDLDDLGRGPSQTDLLALLETPGGNVVLGVEGKVDEPFGEFVSAWLDYSPSKLRRLASVLERLALGSRAVSGLRYQLLHRTAAVLIEAERYSASDAVMLVQSFSPSHIRAGFEDFQKFSIALGTPIDAPGMLSMPRMIQNVKLRLGWCESPLS